MSSRKTKVKMFGLSMSQLLSTGMNNQDWKTNQQKYWIPITDHSCFIIPVSKFQSITRNLDNDEVPWGKQNDLSMTSWWTRILCTKLCCSSVCVYVCVLDTFCVEITFLAEDTHTHTHTFPRSWHDFQPQFHGSSFDGFGGGWRVFLRGLSSLTFSVVSSEY